MQSRRTVAAADMLASIMQAPLCSHCEFRQEPVRLPLPLALLSLLPAPACSNLKLIIVAVL
jgi:hypothetical protein